MTYYIKVDHSKFDGAAEAIEAYIRLQNMLMENAEKEVVSLSGACSGADFLLFSNKWDHLKDPDATSSILITELKSYSEYLRYASSKYKEAQANAINRANRIPRF